MKTILREYRQAWSSLKHKPNFILTIVATMGLTLGALLCALTLNHLLLVEPLPYPEQERLHLVEHQLLDEQQALKVEAFTYPGLMALYKENQFFEQAAVMSYGRDVILSHQQHPRVNTAYVTPELHQMLASPLFVGRLFEKSEALNTNHPVAVLSYASWQQWFDGRDDILEQTVELSGVSYRIIGVLAKGFVEPELAEIGRETHIWLPFDFNKLYPHSKQSYGNVDFSLRFIGKLKSEFNAIQGAQGVSVSVNDGWQQGVMEFDFFKGWSARVLVTPLKHKMLGDSEEVALLLVAGVFGLVLIALTNIANLFMSRTAEKQRQMAIKAAIGATKAHLFRNMLAETSILMGLSIGVALMVAHAGFWVMQHYLDAVLPRVGELMLNEITIGSGLFIALLFAFVLAKLSSRMIDYRTLNTSLQSSGKGNGLQVSKKVRQLLVTSQVSLATILVVANFSLLNNAVKIINTPLDFTTENISTLVLNFASTDIQGNAETAPIMAEIIEQLALLPEVDIVSHSRTPLDGFDIRALTKLTDNERYTPYYKQVDEHYFDLLEQPLIAGQNFSAEHIGTTGRWVMIVNQAFAKQLDPNSEVIGMQIATGEAKNHTIIGVVRDINLPNSVSADAGSTEAGVPRAYAPYSWVPRSFTIKFKSEQSVSRQQLAKLVGQIDRRYSVFSYHTAKSVLRKGLFAEITTVITTAALALIVLFLAGVGLYGVLSYDTQLRRFELGARMAVGATRGHLIGLIVGDNSKAILMGFVGSLVLFLLSYLSFRVFVQTFITWHLVPVMLVSLILIALVTLFGCYWPLRQYMNRPPIFSLRGND